MLLEDVHTQLPQLKKRDTKGYRGEGFTTALNHTGSTVQTCPGEVQSIRIIYFFLLSKTKLCYTTFMRTIKFKPLLRSGY